MLERSVRGAILELSRKGLGSRRITRALRVSRGAVKKVLVQGTQDVPPLERVSRLSEQREEVLRLSETCGGNLVRVHEELLAQGVTVSYPALTAFVRSQSTAVPLPAGQYPFEPGEEIQHDTSPHEAIVGGKRRLVQTASAVLCHSRMLFFQCYPRFTRFEAKVFLTEALRYLGGAPKRVMVDNTNVIRSHGTGAQMVPAPEMAAFAERFGFVFRAHEAGDANRSGRVERPFSYIEGNFLAGRSFEDLRDLNQKAREWCEKVNGSFKRHLHASPRELFAAERPRLLSLPPFIPEPERLEWRTVDHEGFVSVDTNRYSVPPGWLHRCVRVRVTAEKVEIEESGRAVVHERVLLPLSQRVQLPEHRVVRGEKARTLRKLAEERQLETVLPGMGSYVTALKSSGKRAPVLLLRRLLRMAREYPGAPLRDALAEASRFRLYDLDRLERMVLQRIDRDYFPCRRDDE